MMVTFKNLYKSECKELCFTTKKIRKKIIPDYEAQTLRDGDMIEKCEKIEEVIFQIAEHLKKYSGAGLIIDYGKKNNIGNTLQGVKNHSYYDILKNPGKVDLELIEIQTGSYLGEDDIVRFEDRYGRN